MPAFRGLRLQISHLVLIGVKLFLKVRDLLLGSGDLGSNAAGGGGAGRL